MFGLRSDILQKEPRTADWLFDLLAKLGQEDDAYHATCLILMQYDDHGAAAADEIEPDPEGILEPGAEVVADEEESTAAPTSDQGQSVPDLPQVTILKDLTPANLSPSRFLNAMVTRVLGATPVNMHELARQRRVEAARRTT
ncbi:hypothetical protein WKH79_01885 [Qipengyuania sp. GPGPB31]